MSLSSAIRTGLYGALQVAGRSTPLAVAGNTMTVSGLDLANDGNSYRVIVRCKNNTVTLAGYSMYVNGDVVATNYFRESTTYDSTSAGTARANDGLVGIMSASANSVAVIDMVRDIDGFPIADSASSYGVGASSLSSYRAHWQRATAGNVTSISIVGAQNFAINSEVIVYKIGAPSAGIATYSQFLSSLVAIGVTAETDITSGVLLPAGTYVATAQLTLMASGGAQTPDFYITDGATYYAATTNTIGATATDSIHIISAPFTLTVATTVKLRCKLQVATNVDFYAVSARQSKPNATGVTFFKVA